MCAILAGFAGYLPATAAFVVIFGLRLISGLVQSPVFPGNGRIVASWFPDVGAGTSFGHLQFVAVLFARHVRSDPGMDYSSLGLEGVLLVSRRGDSCLELRLAQSGPQRKNAPAHQSGRDSTSSNRAAA